MNTIGICNLNRQLCFRSSDVGRPKAGVAAEYLRRLYPEVEVEGHYGKIPDMGGDFWRGLLLDSLEGGG